MTGASGMVGRNITDHSLSHNYEWLLPSSKELNLCDYTATRTYIDRHKPDFIIHAAGKVGGIQANIKEPVSFLISNLDMGRNVLMAALEVGVPRLINFGSSCMYPKDHQEALCEEDILSGKLEPTNEGYALAKIITTRLAEYISQEHTQLSYKTLIPCNLYGRYDKFDPKYSHMIPAIIHKIHIAKINRESSVEIWGSGQARREFLFAGDLANAVFKAIDEFDKIPSLLNIGLGYDYTIDEYYQKAAEVIGYKGKFSHNPNKPEGMQRKLSNIEKAVKWGWKHTHTLEDGLQKTYQYYLQGVQQ